MGGIENLLYFWGFSCYRGAHIDKNAWFNLNQYGALLIFLPPSALIHYPFPRNAQGLDFYVLYISPRMCTLLHMRSLYKDFCSFILYSFKSFNCFAYLNSYEPIMNNIKSF